MNSEIFLFNVRRDNLCGQFLRTRIPARPGAKRMIDAGPGSGAFLIGRRSMPGMFDASTWVANSEAVVGAVQSLLGEVTLAKSKLG